MESTASQDLLGQLVPPVEMGQRPTQEPRARRAHLAQLERLAQLAETVKVQTQGRLALLERQVQPAALVRRVALGQQAA